MYEIESYITENELCKKIFEKAELLNLKYSIQDKIVGFGKYDNFYMFYIILKSENLNIVIREKYNKDANKITLDLVDDNEEHIMRLILNIYNCYKFGKSNVDISKDVKNCRVKSWTKELEIVIENAKDKKLEDENIPFDKISNRLLTQLVKHNIRTFYDLFSKPPKKIRNWHNCGSKTIKEMIEMINVFANSEKKYVNCDKKTKIVESVCEDINVTKERNYTEKLENIKKRNPEYLVKLQSSIDEVKKCDKLDSKIDFTKLSTRTRNVLKRNKIETFKDIVDYTAAELSVLDNCGVSTLNELRLLLDNYQISNNSRDVKVLLLNTAFSNYFMCDEEVDDMIFEAKEIIQAFDLFIETSVTDSHLDMYKQYIYCDSVTLESIGKSKKITRERVRQIIISENEKLALKFHNINNISIKKQIDNIILKYENEKFLPFIFYGIYMEYSRRYVITLLNVVYGLQNIGIMIMKKLDEYSQFRGQNKSMLLESISNFPCNGNSINKVIFEEIKSTKNDFDYKIFKKAKEIISKLADVDTIIENPNISFLGLNPTFAIKLKNSKIVFVYICNKVKFAVYYNKERFEAMESYCKNNGCGYVVMDDSLNTIFQFKNKILDPNLEVALDKHFENNNLLKWDEVKQIKDKFNCTSDFIITYILQHNLYFSFQPYIIKKIT